MKRKILIWILIVLIAIEALVLSWVYLSVKNKEKYNQQISLGNKYLSETDYENAELCYIKAIEIEDKRSVPYMQLAALYQKQDDFEKALDILETGEKKSVFSEEDEEDVEYIRSVIQSEVNKKQSKEKNDEEKKDEKKQEELDKSVYLEQYQLVLDEYNQAKQYSDTYVYQHRDEFPNVDTGYINHLSDVRYSLYDIDSNGIDELLLYWHYKTGDGYGDDLFDVYSFNGKTAEKLFFKDSSAWRVDFRAYADGTFYVFYTAGSTRAGRIEFYKLGEDGYTLIPGEKYEVDEVKHAQAPYFNDSETLTEDQFQEKLEMHPEIMIENYMELDVPITGKKMEPLQEAENQDKKENNLDNSLEYYVGKSWDELKEDYPVFENAIKNQAGGYVEEADLYFNWNNSVYFSIKDNIIVCILLEGSSEFNLYGIYCGMPWSDYEALRNDDFSTDVKCKGSGSENNVVIYTWCATKNESVPYSRRPENRF